jgi:hypothetical protein
LKNEKHARIIAPAMLLQEDGGVAWDPIYVPPPPEFMLLASGSLPAGMVSMSLRPKAWWATRQRIWDPVWFLLHEALAVPLWFLIGWRIDLGRSQLKKLMLIFLLARWGFGAIDIVSGAARIGAALQCLFWLGVAVYTVISAMAWIYRWAGRRMAEAG